MRCSLTPLKTLFASNTGAVSSHLEALRAVGTRCHRPVAPKTRHPAATASAAPPSGIGERRGERLPGPRKAVV